MRFTNSNFTGDWRILLTIAIALLCLLLSSQLGSLKPLAQIDPFDLLGEGSTLFLVILAVVFVVNHRPLGNVTNLFYSGGLLLIFSMTLDVLDEFFHYPDSLRLLSWLESIPQPVGLVIFGFGALEWRRENKMLTRQLKAREKNLRSHQWIDPLTSLYTTPYFIKLVEREIALGQNTSAEPAVLVRVNFKNFTQYNNERGTKAGDELLHRASELMVLLLRPQDCVCREHSDHFLILLPQTSLSQANNLMKVIRQNLSSELNLPTYTSLEIQTHRVEEVSAADAINALHKQVEETTRYVPRVN
ncbi:signal protein [Idiomarina piscisalsi]|uniref:diguanylate cyclase n=1 Tax=Idiomarina piscisalsi TaxID=1096243 RepID=A0ABN5AS96_9GAMM|nr:diguanylate cyclase [Idiomarina piscisalsi]ASG66793.1 signal protein [Idiomarina piscisalsi]